jgi:hypothetical protein
MTAPSIVVQGGPSLRASVQENSPNTTAYQQCVCGKSVPKIMHAWPMAVGFAAQTNLFGQFIEGAMDLTTIQLVAQTGCK